MRHIMVLNAKGGSGKTTIAINLASYLATKGFKVGLADFDPQGSSLAWLEQRSPARPATTPRVGAGPPSPPAGWATTRSGIHIPGPTPR